MNKLIKFFGRKGVFALLGIFISVFLLKYKYIDQDIFKDIFLFVIGALFAGHVVTDVNAGKQKVKEGSAEP